MIGNEEEREYHVSRSIPSDRTNWWRLSWGAIFAGAFVAMAIFITLQLLGAGIGASALDLTGSRITSGRSLGIGAGIWWFITGLISLFIGGWVAGRLGWRVSKIDRALHGLTMWGVFYVALFLIVTTALGALLGGGFSLLNSSISAAGQAATTPQGQQAIQQATQGQGINAQSIQQQIDKIMGTGGSQQNQQANAQVTTAVNNYLSSSRTPQDRQRAVRTITQATGMSEDQANQMLSNLEQSGQQVSGQQVAGQQAKEQAKETTEKAANITGGTLIGLSIAMIIGAIVSMLGSVLAAMPPYKPPYEHEREHEVAARAGERTYAETR